MMRLIGGELHGSSSPLSGTDVHIVQTLQPWQQVHHVQSIVRVCAPTQGAGAV